MQMQPETDRPMPVSRFELEAWFASPRGRRLLANEAELLSDEWQSLFGRHLVQIGSWGYGDRLLQGHHFAQHSVVGLLNGFGEDVISAPSELPLASDSVDAILLPHSLEMTRDPHALLREVDRVLTARGHLLILGFNPISLWGFSQRLGVGYSAFPSASRFYRSARVCDWLGLLDYDVPRIARYTLSSNLRPRGLAGRMTHMLRDAYLVVARKRVLPMTVIRPRWRQRSTRIPVIGITEARIGHRRG